MPLRVINVLYLGRVDYSIALELQQTLVRLVKEGRISHTLLLLEHPPVITLGRNAGAQNIVASREFLASNGVELHETDRGGDVTFHGPGQLVGYPIFDLREYELLSLDSDLRSYDSAGEGARATGPSGKTSSRKTLSRKSLGAVDYVRRLEEVL